MQRRMAVWLVVPVVCAWLVPERAEACSCVKPPAPKVALKQSAAVFEGKVLGLDAKPDLQRVTARFEVLRVWKGELNARAEVSTIDVDSMCGYGFTVGDTYLVYASGEATGPSTGLSTGLCTRTKASADAAVDFKELGAGEVPKGSGEPVAPAEPVAPVEPVEPVAPAEPVKPVAVEPAPVEPVAPQTAKGCAVDGASGAGLLWPLLLGLRRRRGGVRAGG